MKIGTFDTSGIFKHTMAAAAYQNTIDNYINLYKTLVLFTGDKVFRQEK